MANYEKITYVSKCIYLEQTILFHNRSGERRIALAWNKFWTLSFILLDKTQRRRK